MLKIGGENQPCRIILHRDRNHRNQELESTCFHEVAPSAFSRCQTSFVSYSLKTCSLQVTRPVGFALFFAPSGFPCGQHGTISLFLFTPSDLCTTIRENCRSLRKFSGSRKLSDSHTYRAKRAKDAKFGNLFLFFATFAFFARDIPNFGCGCAAL